MREIIIDEDNFTSAEEVHAFLAAELGFPAHYGANLDALNDCLEDIDEACKVSLYVSDAAGEESEFAAWFPKLVRSFLRASSKNDALDVLVFTASFASIERLLECKGVRELLQSNEYSTQMLVTSSAL